MRENRSAVSQINWQPVYNNSGEEIPAFAAMRISGLESGGEFTVAKPNANDAVSNILFNGPCKIPVASYGMATADVPVSVLYDTADGTPSNGDEWGVESAGWKLRNARYGFLIEGVIDSSVGIATVVRHLSACSMLKVFTDYNAAVAQIPGHDNTGACKWYDVEECDSIADGITIDETPVTGGTNGDVLVIDSGLVGSISTVNLLIAAGGIATAGTVGA